MFNDKVGLEIYNNDELEKLWLFFAHQDIGDTRDVIEKYGLDCDPMEIELLLQELFSEIDKQRIRNANVKGVKQ